MRKISLIIVFALIIGLFTACSNTANTSSPSPSPVTSAKPSAEPSASPSPEPIPEGSYSVNIGIYDWGSAYEKAILEPVGGETADKSKFTAMINNVAMLKISDAYNSDDAGNRDDSGKYITLEFVVGPTEKGPIAVGMSSSTWLTTGCTFTWKDGDKAVKWKTEASRSVPQLEGWKFDRATFNDIELGRALWCPPSDGAKHPLIIWLHGAGEGGKDETIPLSNAYVPNLATDEIQSYFSGAYILAPQSPTMWMDKGNAQYTDNGNTIYAEALMGLIEDTVAGNPDIDANRIYIGGCSNGGFMTMRMILTYPDYFAAAFPTCEAYNDSWITDAQIKAIKNVPIWFIHCGNDPVVQPAATAEATYNRLIAAGAKDIHFFFPPTCVDPTGKYKDAAGQPYSYIGHFAWIYTLENYTPTDYNGKPVQVNGKDVSLFEWLSAHTLSK